MGLRLRQRLCWLLDVWCLGWTGRVDFILILLRFGDEENVISPGLFFYELYVLHFSENKGKSVIRKEKNNRQNWCLLCFRNVFSSCHSNLPLFVFDLRVQFDLVFFKDFGSTSCPVKPNDLTPFSCKHLWVRVSIK